jgi:hypothetical protein
MTQPNYCRKPVLVEAIQFDGKNLIEVMDFFNYLNDVKDPKHLVINTTNGFVTVEPTDWIVREQHNLFVYTHAYFVKHFCSFKDLPDDTP